MTVGLGFNQKHLIKNKAFIGVESLKLRLSVFKQQARLQMNLK
jgi:hypothetical protein